MSNVTNKKKKELIQQLINRVEESSYHERRELTDSLRVSLKFITDESETVLKRITTTGRVTSISMSESENHRHQLQAFDRFKSNAISILNSLLTEIELFEHFEDVPDQTNREPQNQEPSNHHVFGTPALEVVPHSKTKIFIVHGHDDGLKNEVALFVQRLGIEPIILHEQANRGHTIIEKIEANSDVGFAIVLYTPCDMGRVSSSKEEKPRARQNVVFEHGYFVAKLGRENVVALNKGYVEVPNDLSGMIYTSYDQNTWKRDIAHELHHSGYNIDFSRV